MQRLTSRNEWRFFSVLPRADAALAGLWWLVLVLRGTLPAVFAIAMGRLVSAIQRGDDLAAPLTLVGTAFVLWRVLDPIHTGVSANLGDRTAAWLYDRLTEACVRPLGMAHLEDPRLTSDLTVAREFDLGMTGPPLSLSLGLVAGGTIDQFVRRRKRLHELQYRATRLRERPLVWSMLLVIGANLVVFWSLASAAADGRLDLGALVTFAQSAVGTSMIAFGGLNWALDGAAAPVAAVLRLEPSMRVAGALSSGVRRADGLPAREIRFRGVSFAYPGSGLEVLDGFDVCIPAGSSLAIVGPNGAGKTTLAKLLCRLYDPQAGAIEIDGVDLRELDLDSWRARVTAVFQDFIRFELPLRDNVAPRGAPDEAIRAALTEAGAAHLADLDTVLARGYRGGIDLSGGQWQRVALARAVCAVRLGAGLVLLDEPTAQLDVRGEAEIFDRVLAATRHTTTILISHRFSTVRHADRICVLEHGRVVELGTHTELMALGGRYRTMFDLQAQRFYATEDEEGLAYDVLA
jgi:ABC-type multidrug transport system fused ATPase/permease subunit